MECGMPSAPPDSTIGGISAGASLASPKCAGGVVAEGLPDDDGATTGDRANSGSALNRSAMTGSGWRQEKNNSHIHGH
jgi:hypothetical protein